MIWPDPLPFWMFFFVRGHLSAVMLFIIRTALVVLPMPKSPFRTKTPAVKFCWHMTFRHREVLPIECMWRLYIYPVFLERWRCLNNEKTKKHIFCGTQPKYMDNCCNTRSYYISSRRASFQKKKRKKKNTLAPEIPRNLESKVNHFREDGTNPLRVSSFVLPGGPEASEPSMSGGLSC